MSSDENTTTSEANTSDGRIVQVTKQGVVEHQKPITVYKFKNRYRLPNKEFLETWLQFLEDTPKGTAEDFVKVVRSVFDKKSSDKVKKTSEGEVKLWDNAKAVAEGNTPNADKLISKCRIINKKLKEDRDFGGTLPVPKKTSTETRKRLSDLIQEKDIKSKIQKFMIGRDR